MEVFLNMFWTAIVPRCCNCWVSDTVEMLDTSLANQLYLHACISACW